MERQFKIGVIGVGFVGNAITESLKMKGLVAVGYDKFKDGGIGSFEEVIKNDILFLCLPTVYKNELKEYDKSIIYEVCQQLVDVSYSGIVVIKSTVEIGTTNYLLEKYPLKYIHNPEFLTARTAIYDFHHQEHIVLGVSSKVSLEELTHFKSFYEIYYFNTPISVCTTNESEAMKISCNSFYATKVQFFNEIYAICGKMDISYNAVKDLMLKNKWINPMHCDVPGSDGALSFSGACLPKDLSALNEHMNRLNTPHAVINAALKERNTMRHDNVNC
jgi:nucleotide sugar dehydrogenase